MEQKQRQQQQQIEEQLRLQQQQQQQQQKQYEEAQRAQLLELERARQREQQQVQLEAKRRMEKYMERERKTRDKWLEHIVTRERMQHQQQHSLTSSSSSSAMPSSHSLVPTSAMTPMHSASASATIECLDDMQDRCLHALPDMQPLHVAADDADDEQASIDQSLASMDWLGDSLQVVEFVRTFGDKLKEWLASTIASESATTAATTTTTTTTTSTATTSSSNASEPSTSTLLLLQLLPTVGSSDGSCEQLGGSSASYQFESIVSSVESFRLALENKSDKMRRELGQLAQLLTRLAVHNAARLINTTTTTKRKSPTDENVNEDEDEDDAHFMRRLAALELGELTYGEIMRLYMRRALLELEKRRRRCRFSVDVTQALRARLDVWTRALRRHAFEQLAPPLKAAALAFLCDELLNACSSFVETAADAQQQQQSTGGTRKTNKRSENNDGDDQNRDDDDDEDENDENEMEMEREEEQMQAVACDESTADVLVKEIDAAIEQLAAVKHERWQIEQKARALRAERLNAAAQLQQILLAAAAATNATATVNGGDATSETTAETQQQQTEAVYFHFWKNFKHNTFLEKF